MSRATIAAAMIAGDSARIDPTEIHRCLKSLELHVDAVYIAYNGEGELDLPAIAPPIFVQNFEWDDDFAKMRNQNLGMIPREAYDWMLWVDTDDTVNGDFQEVLKDIKPETQGVFLRYDYAVDLETDQVLAVQWRERLLRTDANWKWHYPIHEVCHAPTATQYARKTQAWIRHWRQLDKANARTRERNRRILIKARKEFPDEPRFNYYFANEVYAEAADAVREGKPALELLNAAIKAYDDYIPDAPSPDDAYLALHQIGECRRLAKDYEGAIKAEAEALLVHPGWPDAYVGIAQGYMQLEDWDKCLHWATAALNNCSEAETTQVREPLNNEYLPHLLRALSFEAKGEYDNALEELDILSQTTIASDEINSKITRIYELREKAETPEVITDHKVKKNYTRLQASHNNQRSICFFHRPLFEPWHPEIIKEGGIGGSEIAAIELSKRFAADGWRTVVYGSPGDYVGVDSNGVEWYDAHEWRPTEEYDVFVSSRTPDVFDHNIKAKCSILWMHDVNVGPVFEGPWGPRITANQPTFVGALTNWHANHLRRLYDVPEEKLIILPNGINPTRFKDSLSVPKQANKFVWSSSPDRGLDVVINLWPEIRQQYPDAELHIFYGWEAINKILELQPDHHLSIFKDSVNSAITNLGGEGIVWHGRQNQNVLAGHLMTCDVWLYPGYFLETFCITALEMQSAGVLPLCTNIGGLKETVAAKDNLITGWPNNEDFKKRYFTRLNELQFMGSIEKNALRALGTQFANQFTWDAAYEKWDQNIRKVIEKKVIVNA